MAKGFSETDLAGPLYAHLAHLGYTVRSEVKDCDIAATKGESFYRGPIAERIARSRVPDLPQPAVAYTRKVTRAWCVFFAGNALVALWTALWCSDRVWFTYNGIIAYALAGLMFAGEWLVRRRVLRCLYG